MSRLVGPLTTTFTTPPPCSSLAGIHIAPCGGTDCVYWAEGPLFPAAECYPALYNPTLGNYYSPGLCPSGYTPACTKRTKISTLTETVHTCCPTALGYTYQCIGSATWPWQTSLGCTVSLVASDGELRFPEATFVDGESTKMTSTARTEVGIGAYGIEVRYQAGDFAKDPGVTGAASTEGSGTSRTSATSTSRTDTVGSARGGSAQLNAGLSSGAAAGIGVGATVLAVSLIGLGVWAWRRKRKSKNQNAVSEAGDGPRHTGGPYPIPVDSEAVTQTHEIDDPKQTPVYYTGTQVHEADTEPRAYELPNTHGRAEVD